MLNEKSHKRYESINEREIQSISLGIVFPKPSVYDISVGHICGDGELEMRGTAGFLRILFPTITPIRKFAFNYFSIHFREDILGNETRLYIYLMTFRFIESYSVFLF